jgi:hypothetical protein
METHLHWLPNSFIYIFIEHFYPCFTGQSSVFNKYFFFRCVKFEESNDKSQLIFGSVTIIPAVDALPLEVSSLHNGPLQSSTDAKKEEAL